MTIGSALTDLNARTGLLTPPGIYFLNLQVAPFEMDASPSRPVLFKIFE